MSADELRRRREALVQTLEEIDLQLSNDGPANRADMTGEEWEQWRRAALAARASRLRELRAVNAALREAGATRRDQTRLERIEAKLDALLSHAGVTLGDEGGGDPA